MFNRSRGELKRIGACVYILAIVLFAHNAHAFTDGSGYQILLTVKSSLTELKKHLKELKQSREILQSINELSVDEASTTVKKQYDRYKKKSHQLNKLYSDVGVNETLNPDTNELSQTNDQTKATITQLRQVAYQLQTQEKTLKRKHLLRVVQDKIKQMNQEELVNNYSLSDRQARDIQTELLLELVNYEREQRELRHRDRQRADRYLDGLRNFLY